MPRLLCMLNDDIYVLRFIINLMTITLSYPPPKKKDNYYERIYKKSLYYKMHHCINTVAIALPEKEPTSILFALIVLYNEFILSV